MFLKNKFTIWFMSLLASTSVPCTTFQLSVVRTLEMYTWGNLTQYFILCLSSIVMYNTNQKLTCFQIKKGCSKSVNTDKLDWNI